MSQEHLWAAIGRSRVDLEFSGRLLLDPVGALRHEGYELSSEELQLLRTAVAPPPSPQYGMPGFPAMAPEDIQFQRAKMQERMTAQVARSNELGAYTVSILKRTLDNARSAYRTITWMNTATFVTGIGLFIAAAIYGVNSQDTKTTLLLAGMGVANFVAFFVLGPIERTQAALSNLVQVEIAFMNYFEQITFWETYALAPVGNPPAPSPANIKEASEQLQRRSHETIVLLQEYVENATNSRDALHKQQPAAS